MRAHVAVALLRPTLRAVPWISVAAGALLGLILVAVPASLVELEPRGWATVLRLAAVAGAVGAAFLLDDPADRTTVVMPTPRLLRRAVRVALLLPLLALWWAAALLALRALAGAAQVDGLPLAGLTVEAVALLAAAIAIAALAGGTGDGGVTGAVGVLAGALLACLPPRPYALVLEPADPAWDGVHGMWALVIAAALIAFAVAGRDPGAQRLTHVLFRRPPWQ